MVSDWAITASTDALTGGNNDKIKSSNLYQTRNHSDHQSIPGNELSVRSSLKCVDHRYRDCLATPAMMLPEVQQVVRGSTPAA